MAQLARFSPAAVVQRITRGGDVVGERLHTIDEIVAEAKQHRPNVDESLIRRAYETATAAHALASTAGAERQPVQVNGRAASWLTESALLWAGCAHPTSISSCSGNPVGVCGCSFPCEARVSTRPRRSYCLSSKAAVGPRSSGPTAPLTRQEQLPLV